MTETMGQKREPLAERMRPKTLGDVVGQDHLLGSKKPLSVLAASDRLPSMVLWGPPGSGKTTIAHLLAGKRRFFSISAVLSGIQELRHVVSQCEKEQDGGVVFIDEIHRWHKGQQDALLPFVEKGTITLIGATTENPSFEIISPLLSRVRVFVLRALRHKDLETLLRRGLNDSNHGLQGLVSIDDDAAQALCEMASGDGRQLLNQLEIAAEMAPHISLQVVKTVFERRTFRYDKKGDDHYDTISAFIKSMRGSDPDAAVYYLARMVESGEDLRFVARRMVIFAAEDIGNADPRALQLAIAAAEAFDRVGQAQGWIPLSQAAIYLACAPKSNACYVAYVNARRDVERTGNLPVPYHLRNAPTQLMKRMGYGDAYEYAHNRKDGRVSHAHLPEALVGKTYYVPTQRGVEIKIKERLAWLKQKR